MTTISPFGGVMPTTTSDDVSLAQISVSCPGAHQIVSFAF
jgi:hypothetical protein